MQRLTKIVVWKLRTRPSNRIVPPHLKLAILARGRIEVPAGKLKSFFDLVALVGAKWPEGLTKTLQGIRNEYLMTIELFINQRLTMTPQEIRGAIEGYLILRHKSHLKENCYSLPFVTLPAVQRRVLENKIEVEIGELFRRARVVLRPNDNPFQYVLVCYACLPSAVARFVPLQREVPSPPPTLPLQMPPVDGVLKANTEAHLRASAGKSAASMGVQAGTAAHVKVLGKQEADGELWYSIELLEPVRVVPNVGDPLHKATHLPAGTKGWIASWALDVVASWALLRYDISKFDEDHRSLSLGDRITALRQRMHRANLPFDDIIGRKRGTVYLDNIPFEAGHWQLGRDYQAFVAPDGRWVDLQHLAVALDVLAERENPASYLGTPVGTNYAAATWSGDVGSAAAEATLRRDITTWERWNQSTTDSVRIHHYFSTRAPDHDLLGDLDGWGIVGLREADSRIDKIEELLTSYYEKQKIGPMRPLTGHRSLALKRFLEHYQLTYDPESDYANYPVFPRNSRTMNRFAGEIALFAYAWMHRQDPNLAFRPPEAKRPKYVAEVTVLFLWWL